MHPSNNINGINGDPNSDGKVLETHTLDDPAITAIQDAYICKVVDTLKDQPDVIIEASNEEPFNSSPWQNHVFDRVRTCEVQLGSVRHQLWQSPYYFGSPGLPDNSEMYTNHRLDIVGPACLGGENFQTNPRRIGTKPVLWDSDHANATCNGTLTPSMIGTFFTRGVHLSSLGERESASVVTQLIQRQAQVVSYSRRMGLATMEPDSNGQQTYPATAMLDDFERADEDPVASSWITAGTRPPCLSKSISIAPPKNKKPADAYRASGPMSAATKSLLRPPRARLDTVMMTVRTMRSRPHVR